MFNLSGSEIIVILLLALVVLGPEKLPEALRRAGRTYAELKKLSSGFQAEVRSAFEEPVQEMRETADLLRKAATFDGEPAPASKPTKLLTDADAAPASGAARLDEELEPDDELDDDDVDNHFDHELDDDDVDDHFDDELDDDEVDELDQVDDDEDLDDLDDDDELDDGLDDDDEVLDDDDEVLEDLDDDDDELDDGLDDDEVLDGLDDDDELDDGRDDDEVEPGDDEPGGHEPDEHPAVADDDSRRRDATSDA